MYQTNIQMQPKLQNKSKTTYELFDDDKSLPLDKQMETYMKLLFFLKYNSWERIEPYNLVI